MEILSPVAEKKIMAAQVLSSLDNIYGKTIGILDNGWRSGDIIIGKLEELFRAESVRTYRQRTEASGPDPKELHDNVAKNCDAAVVVIAN
ncbi:hypothetical protein FJZ33_00680 [Candidatus Poribacteria bacterium]|nr:hypothetical protein [Candidatus Poribacteria bacterium]